MKSIFVDTGAWYALIDKKDPEHSSAAGFLRANTFPLLTTNFIFDETVTLLRKRLGWNLAIEFGQKLKKSGFVSIASIKDEDEERAWEVFLKYKDKDFSYTDCTSFSFMQRLKTDTVFSFDAHFKAMRFKMVPE